MGIPSRILMALTAVGITTATQSISLSNFTPRIENLPTTCQNAYITGIEGCTKDDFGTGALCSAKCVQGLVKISDLVAVACQTVNVPDTSIIGVFLLSRGVQALCPGITVVTKSSTTKSTQSVQSTQTTTSQSLSSTTTSQARTTASASSAPSTQSSGASTSSSATTSPTPTQTNQATTQPPSTLQSQLTTDTRTPPPASSQTGSQQANAGGGSPFDIGATASASQLHLGSTTVLATLLLAILIPILS
ncbi:hypothetical protein P280DRAFT_477377 [Massarina eburnea CBS 473.64]|uniref:Extracellular membrane protein CFEM domain-containing protein n=1 Tax=Massarina eburnea CBS 473.64 TaxID=1395130 RepID=A0A6A6S8P2_9PLEO|nr:hypothetical protein P280DRAFT_477377 [Massarina eburnea CBS 473.64]